MFLILSEISFEELIEKKDLKKYACSCDYFSLILMKSKSEIAEQAVGWVTWYSFFSTVPLYVSVITNKYWASVCGNLDRTVRLTTWKTIPRYIEETRGENSSFHLVKDLDRICSEQDINKLSEKIKNHNYRNNPDLCMRIGKAKGEIDENNA